MSYNPKKPKTPKTPTVIKPTDPEPKPEPVVNEPEPTIEEPEPVIVDPVIEEPEPEIIEEETTIVEKKNVVVCLDNGHGSDTPGKCSPWSACKVPPEIPFREYEYCRDIVRRLAPILEKEGFTVYIVTPEEKDISLTERGARINKVVAESATKGMRVLSISVHNNAAGMGREWKEAYGWSIWTTRGQNNSDILAQCLYDAADEVLPPLGQKSRHDRSDGDDDYEADFAMCRIPKCPAVLTENMFQDCIKEVQFLLTEEGRNAIVEIHRRGIIKFVEKMKW
jgi:N-acetylmuramoyl-L-alanine amidase